MRSEPAVEVLAVQPLAAPSPVGCDVNVEPVILNPVGVVHAVTLAVVHASNETDFTAVDDGTVNEKA
jgi:hypothetical protein